jgi:hypothetical protein
LKSERWKESDGMKSSLCMLRMLTVSGMKVPANNESLSEMIKLYKGRSMYKIDVDMSDVTQILTLVSCDYSIDDGRIIIHARLINE